MDVKELSEVSDKHREELNTIIETLKRSEGSMEDAVHKIDGFMEDVEHSYDRALADIDAKCDSIENALKACRQQLKAKALEAKSFSKDSGLAAKAKATLQWGVLTSHRCFADRVSQSFTPASITDIPSMLKQRAAALDPADKVPEFAKGISQRRLHVDPVVVADIKQKLSGLGTVTEFKPCLMPVYSWFCCLLFLL
jgi:hypothetical protein